MTGVFINYRSSDGQWAAETIYRDLAAAFGAGYVFLDKQAILPGVPYPAKIRTWIREHCSVMIAVIGPGWLNATGADGNQLLFRPNDWVHDEIADALTLRLPVVAVPLHDTPLPSVTDLPSAIAGLVVREGMRIRDFDRYDDADSLVRCLAALDPVLAQDGQETALVSMPAWADRASGAMSWGAAQLYRVVYSADMGALLMNLTRDTGGSAAGAASVLRKMPEKRAAALLESMGKDRAVPILLEMKPYKRWEIMTRLPSDFRHEAQKRDYRGFRQDDQDATRQ